MRIREINLAKVSWIDKISEYGLFYCLGNTKYYFDMYYAI
jgi:hypothetical protein